MHKHFKTKGLTAIRLVTPLRHHCICYNATMNSSSNNPTVGRFRHYKGGEYEVFAVATHTETEEKMVVYRSVIDGEKVWVRPYDMFFDKVTINGETIPRFTEIT